MANSPDGEPESDPITCRVCGTDVVWVDCFHCYGDGEFDLHEEDAINYLPGEEYETCSVCHGAGGYLECPNVENHQRNSSAANAAEKRMK